MSRFGIALLLAAQISLSAQDKDREAAIEQWRAQRVGLFVHWGVATCSGASPR